jgi:hypothetical protein
VRPFAFLHGVGAPEQHLAGVDRRTDTQVNTWLACRRVETMSRLAARASAPAAS